ncbi:hypothetical protein V4D00_17440 [Ralstonia solanacearum]|uniref:alpha-glutamyl/putrescinyl thymine pyrophosphorylase clade 3 protein n=1 Tax=Ralstonia solanacearum TaxID=305 RepID=UPI002F94F081
MRLRDQALAADLEEKLLAFRVDNKPLPGITEGDNRAAYVEQLVESVRRVKFVSAIGQKVICEERLDPKSDLFDPLRAATLYRQQGNLDEAFWLAFLFVHFGKSLRTRWNLTRAIYGAWNDKFVWTWEQFNSAPNVFTIWFNQHLPELLENRKQLQFGNHRKYESLERVDAVLESYVEWVGPEHSHAAMIERARAVVGNDPRALFGHLYKSMDAVHRFGRTAKFDYLTMVAKLGLVDLRAPSAYMVGATGPLSGARLLFAGTTEATHISRAQADHLLVALDNHLNVGMQVLEDSLCNWQKSPNKFVAFRG